jgi:hypothetical protein
VPPHFFILNPVSTWPRRRISNIKRITPDASASNLFQLNSRHQANRKPAVYTRGAATETMNAFMESVSVGHSADFNNNSLKPRITTDRKRLITIVGARTIVGRCVPLSAGIYNPSRLGY